MEAADKVLSLDLKDPFDVRVFDDFLTPGYYKVLASTFPTHGFRVLDIGSKIHLNREHPDFDDFIQSHSIWRDFYEWCEAGSLEAVVRDSIELGTINSFRFEFSILPSNGGYIWPHADVAKKRATVVFYFPPEGWQRSWGGGFEVLRVLPGAKNPKKPSWDEVETVTVIDFIPNRVVMMKKTDNSFHCVRPIGGPPGRQRRSVTINLCGGKK